MLKWYTLPSPSDPSSQMQLPIMLNNSKTYSISFARQYCWHSVTYIQLPNRLLDRCFYWVLTQPQSLTHYISLNAASFMLPSVPDHWDDHSRTRRHLQLFCHSTHSSDSWLIWKPLFYLCSPLYFHHSFSNPHLTYIIKGDGFFVLPASTLAPSPIFLPHDFHSKLLKRCILFKPSRLLSLPRGQTPKSSRDKGSLWDLFHDPFLCHPHAGLWQVGAWQFADRSNYFPFILIAPSINLYMQCTFLIILLFSSCAA